MLLAECTIPMQHGPVTDPLIEEHRSLFALVASDRDRAAFQALFLHFGPRIKSLMMKAGADSAQAEDLVQDVMTTLWRKAELYDPAKGSVSAWIYAVARNARIDRLRRKSSQPYVDVETLDLAADQPDGEDEMTSSQIAERVSEALGQLPDDQREVIDLAYVQDMSQSEIAEKLTLPLGTVKSRMRLAYARLKPKLVDLQ